MNIKHKAAVLQIVFFILLLDNGSKLIKLLAQAAADLNYYYLHLGYRISLVLALLFLLFKNSKRSSVAWGMHI